MNDPVQPSAHEDLRRQFLAHAAAAFDLLFHPEHQPDLVTFDQREQRAHEIATDLEAWLLGQHANADPLAGPAEGASVPCPRWGQPAKLVPREGRPLFQRSLTTRAGAVVLKRSKWRCTTCRVAFFPSGPQARVGG